MMTTSATLPSRAGVLRGAIAASIGEEPYVQAGSTTDTWRRLSMSKALNATPRLSDDRSRLSDLRTSSLWRAGKGVGAVPPAPAAGELRLVVQRVRDLLSEDYSDAEGERAPSQEIIDRATGLLNAASHRMSGGLPRGFASTSGAGDVRVYWRANDRDVHLAISEGSPENWSLYVRAGNQETFTRGVSADVLADALTHFAAK